MYARRRLLALFLPMLFVAAGILQCRRATAVAEDPLDREAEQALVEYLKIDTSNPPGNETAGARYLHDLLRRNGIEAALVGADPKRQSVHARLRSGSSEKALLLLSHIDVVPVVPGEWTKPPFGGTIAEGYIWGRGALDIKSLGIAQAMALIELKRRNLPLRRDVVLLAVADEEMGGLRGCGELLDTRPDLFANVGFVINEGGYNDTIVDRVSFWGIEIHQKVPLWLRIHARGAPGHAAAPPDDGGSAAKLIRALANIEKVETPYRLTSHVRDYFRAAGAAKKDERGELLRTLDEPLDVARIDRVLPPGYRALLRDTITITRLSGGASVNSIPAHATAEIDIRMLPDSNFAPMLQRIKEAAGEDVEVEVMLAATPTPASSAETELFATMAKAMQDDEKGSVVAPVVGAGTTDSRFFRARGIVAYGLAPFKVNYYDAGTAHGNDERIRARFFAEGSRLVRRIVRDFCAKAE